MRPNEATKGGMRSKTAQKYREIEMVIFVMEKKKGWRERSERKQALHFAKTAIGLCVDLRADQRWPRRLGPEVDPNFFFSSQMPDSL